MQDINNLVNETLDSVFNHYYDSMPEFAEGEEPDIYAVYFIRDKPSAFSSGIYLAKTYWVSVSIISLEYDRKLYRLAEAAFRNAGFIYSGGSDVKGYESSEPYPHRCQHSQEYLITIETEE